MTEIVISPDPVVYEGQALLIEATADDSLMAVLHFSGGAMGQWTQSYAAHGQSFGHRVLYGSQGSLRPCGTRNGKSPASKRRSPSTSRINKWSKLKSLPHSEQ